MSEVEVEGGVIPGVGVLRPPCTGMIGAVRDRADEHADLISGVTIGLGVAATVIAISDGANARRTWTAEGVGANLGVRSDGMREALKSVGGP